MAGWKLGPNVILLADIGDQMEKRASVSTAYKDCQQG